MKKLMLLYALAVATVIVYFVLRLFFSQEKEIEREHFNTQIKEVGSIKKEDMKEKETENKQKFMLLPQR